MNLTFEWDEEKAALNFRKHKIGFDEAKSIFTDPFYLTFPDPLHSEDEPRCISIGASLKGRILVVIYLEREENIRIISCRKATPSERETYEEGN